MKPVKDNTFSGERKRYIINVHINKNIYFKLMRSLQFMHFFQIWVHKVVVVVVVIQSIYSLSLYTMIKMIVKVYDQYFDYNFGAYFFITSR